MLLDEERLAAELLELVIGENKSRALLVGGLDGADFFFDLIAVGIDHLRRFLAEQARKNGRPARFEIRLVDIEFVWVDRPLDDGFTETVASGDENDVVETGFRVEREGDPARREIASHHALHARRDPNLAMRESLMHPIGDGTVVVERGENFLDRHENMVETFDVQKAFLLARERSFGHILRRGRRAHREGISLDLLKGFERFADGGRDVVGEGRLFDRTPNLAAHARELEDVLDIELFERVVDTLVEPGFLQEQMEGVRRGCEASGDSNAELGEVADHLAERRVLASDEADIRHPGLVERFDVR